MFSANRLRTIINERITKNMPKNIGHWKKNSVLDEVRMFRRSLSQLLDWMAINQFKDHKRSALCVHKDIIQFVRGTFPSNAFIVSVCSRTIFYSVSIFSSTSQRLPTSFPWIEQNALELTAVWNRRSMLHAFKQQQHIQQKKKGHKHNWWL